MDLYLETSYKLSKLLTQRYSTSFSMGIMLFPKRYRYAVCGVYGFVRLADEIVDTFHNHDKTALFDHFRKQTDEAIAANISLNPILNAFQDVVNKHDIRREYIDAFLTSMEMDLTETSHDSESYKKYIYGSAEVVGLMCLQIFCAHDTALFNRLSGPARHLGSAFQKVNFLRDVKSDLEVRRRIYFPDTHEKEELSNANKITLEQEVAAEFQEALSGIRQLPSPVRLGVYTAYLYYQALFSKIRKTGIHTLLEKRVRIPNFYKFLLLIRAYFTVRTLKQ